MPPLTNMECVALIVIALACVLPCAIQAWLSARTQTRLSRENATLIAAVLGLSDKPSAVMLGRQVEANAGEQSIAEADRKTHPLPSRRPPVGAT